jgi:hypothetical protein
VPAAADGGRTRESALALSAAKGLASAKTHETAAETLRRLAKAYGLSGVVDSLPER